MKKEAVKQNLTKQNKDKIMQILKDKMQENFMIIANKNENANLQQIVQNLQFKYTFKGLNNKQKQQLKEFFDKAFISNLQQFLKQKSYNLTKSPVFKTQFNNKNEIEFGFLNMMEVNNTNTILNNEILKEFEKHLFDKINFLFDLDFNIKEEEKNEALQKQNLTQQTNLSM